ncbi:hypothetical protein PP641_gp014 [Arthrobacter phage SilentRX]|uniref:Uncharacterized protein n=1 Tax=Arthrobacter phage SilentRX TaxID=2836091 RepID=A0A8F3E8L6_9CAUD|nr:hypothetical protein PP641_gp014 [Arthrobacter phage SilentRX]QWY82757.1 hypothetical protein SEA_SILENTRX_14 [Arthrobacter phage SilentRX]
MAIKRIMELDVSKGTSKEELQRFIDGIPDAAKVSSQVTQHVGDRPWEPGSFTLKVVAEWSE